MPLPRVLPSLTILAFVASACGLGSVDVIAEKPMPEPAAASLQPDPPPAPPLAPGLPTPVPSVIPERPFTEPIIVAAPDAGSDDVSNADAGNATAPPDAAAPPPPSPRPVLVDTPVELPLVGLVGGGPRLGTCQGGVAVGVRATANPNEGVFGQRLTFLEPVCASASVNPPGESPQITLRRDDSILSWATNEPFLGVPSNDVPDDRLVWVAQPPALCPDTAPVLVGLSGEVDPVAPDATDTDAFRSLVIECAPLVLASNGIDLLAAAEGHLLLSPVDSFAATGSDTYRASCAGGTVITQLHLHSGFWLDGFLLGCSGLRLAP